MWMFTSKWIKLLGHYIRYPVDVFLLPVSILFGYFHGAIKMYAVMTLNVVSCIRFTSLLFPMIFSLAGQWRKSERSGKSGGSGSGLGVGCLSVPLFL
jgi:fucose permease